MRDGPDNAPFDPLFDRSGEYNAMLAKGLALSGEDKGYFLRGRILDLRARLPAAFVPRRILDFGCGLGDASHFLAHAFPQALVVGADLSEPTLEYARSHFSSERVTFCSIAALGELPRFDLCYVNGVFHHIEAGKREGTMELLRALLHPAGHLAVFENNPWNPGARLVMWRIPFDRDAVPVSSPAMGRLLRSHFRVTSGPWFLFYFPSILKWLRAFEPGLARWPLGAQYYWIATPLDARTAP
ncbi:MAG: class I SAM-dependent methyltransferase [Magnetococcales bacterium]|nr:class I SAM-dependent methyltransferase [Magnetococcales bacterium]